MIQKIAIDDQMHGSQDLTTFDSEESRMRNDRQTVFALVRELVHAQFQIADQELTNRLWKDIAERGIDLDRVIHLMYGSATYDDQEMLDADLIYEKD